MFDWLGLLGSNGTEVEVGPEAPRVRTEFVSLNLLPGPEPPSWLLVLLVLHK